MGTSDRLGAPNPGVGLLWNGKMDLLHAFSLCLFFTTLNNDTSARAKIHVHDIVLHACITLF